MVSPGLVTFGRGGAGNMAAASKSPRLTPKDLETPTLKTPIITTGRGGTGNMAKNINPRETRLRQDVEDVPRRRSSGAQHSGRGGAGNVFIAEEIAANKGDEHAIDDSSSRKSSELAHDLAARAKHLFGRK